MRRTVINVSLLALLSVGAGALSQVVVSAPAFNEDLRQGNVFGDVTLLLGSDMYHRPSYLYQQAASFVRADLIPDLNPEAEQSIVSVEVAQERAFQAVALAQESLALDPGNAGAWTVLAWGHLLSGNPHDAATALATSWDLSPYSLSLSVERLSLAFTIFDGSLYVPSVPGPQITQQQEQGMMRDLETLWTSRRNLYTVYSAKAQALDLPSFVPPQGS